MQSKVAPTLRAFNRAHCSFRSDFILIDQLLACISATECQEDKISNKFFQRYLIDLVTDDVWLRFWFINLSYYSQEQSLLLRFDSSRLRFMTPTKKLPPITSTRMCTPVCGPAVLFYHALSTATPPSSSVYYLERVKRKYQSE